MGAPEGIESVFTGTVNNCHYQKTPNHPHLIGTCYIRIQVSRESHEITLKVMGKGKKGVGWVEDGEQVPHFFLLAPETMPLITSRPLCGNKSCIIKAH